MGITTLFGYLIGRRQAILQLAASRHSLWIGFLFVLSAGFARNYDAVALPQEWWHLYVPVVASLFASYLLFAFAYLKPPGTHYRHQFYSAYLSFLGLFWMTAPLAWLYAIPYERFLTELGAAQANMATLGLVAAWRMALMMRVLVVLLNYRPSRAIYTVLTFVSAVAMLLPLIILPQTILSGMGGVHTHTSEAEIFVNNVAGFVGCLALPCFLVSFYIMGWDPWKPDEGKWQLTDDQLKQSNIPRFSLWGLALASLAIWAMVLPLTQPEQQLRYRVEYAFEKGDLAFALAEMSAHAPDDFPPHWTPPPRKLSRYNEQEQLHSIWNHLNETSPPPWVREVYLDKVRHVLKNSYYIRDQDSKIFELLVLLPEGEKILQEAIEAETWDIRKERLEELHRYIQALKKEDQKIEVP